MPDFYILADREPVPASLDEWIAWQETHNQERQVACSVFADGPRVSTVFTGVNLSFDDTPLLFETMIFWEGHALDRMQCRTATWQEAEAMHQRCCEKVSKALEAQKETTTHV